MRQAAILIGTLFGLLLAGGCQSGDPTAYDHALVCLEAANVMEAAASVLKAPSELYQQAGKTWFANAVSEASKLGRSDGDVRGEMSARLDRAMARFLDESGRPDLEKTQAALREQEARYKSCS